MVFFKGTNSIFSSILRGLFVLLVLGSAVACTLQAKITDLGSTAAVEKTSGTISYSLSSTVINGYQVLTITPTITGQITSCSVSPSLPAGMSINASTGVISGTPSLPTVTNTYTVTCLDGLGAQQTSTLNFEVAGYYTVDATSDASDAAPGNGVCATAGSVCTLRAAIEESTSQPTGTLGIVNLPAGTVTLTSELSISTRINIEGVSSTASIIDGNNATRILTQTDSQLSLKKLRMYRGNSATAGGGMVVNVSNGVTSQTTIDQVDFVQNTTSSVSNGGGAIYYRSDTGTLNISNTNFTSNSLASGGGSNLGGGAIQIERSEAFNISKTNFTSNTITGVNGGAIHVRASAVGGVISECYFLSNSISVAAGDGGALSAQANLTILKSTFVSNSARRGGAVHISAAAVATIENSTFYGNLANSGTQQGAALYITSSGGQQLINSSTFISNAATSAGGAIYTLGSGVDVSFSNSIFSGNTPTNCAIGSGSITSGGYNIDSAASCGFAGTGDASTTNPLVVAGAPVNNGGFVPTIALQVTSPAIDAGSSSAPSTDARGTARPRGASNDKGAYEY